MELRSNLLEMQKATGEIMVGAMGISNAIHVSIDLLDNPEKALSNMNAIHDAAEMMRKSIDFMSDAIDKFIDASEPFMDDDEPFWEEDDPFMEEDDE